MRKHNQLLVFMAVLALSLGMSLVAWNWPPLLPVKMAIDVCKSSSVQTETESAPSRLKCEHWTVYLDQFEFLYLFDNQNGLLEDLQLQRSFNIDIINKVKWPYKPISHELDAETSGAESQDLAKRLIREAAMQPCSKNDSTLGICESYVTKDHLGQKLRVVVRPKRWFEEQLIRYQDHQNSAMTEKVANQIGRDQIIFRIENLDDDDHVISYTELSQFKWHWPSALGLGSLVSQRPPHLVNLAETFADRKVDHMREIRELQKMKSSDREAYLRSQGVQILEVSPQTKED